MGPSWSRALLPSRCSCLDRSAEHLVNDARAQSFTVSGARSCDHDKGVRREPLHIKTPPPRTMTMRIPSFILLSCLAACSLETTGPGAEPVSRTQSAIYNGKRSDSSQNAVVLLVGPLGICSGTLLAPRLVLTARHCVSQTTGGGIACERDEASGIAVATFGQNHKPSSIEVFVGSRYEDFIQDGVPIPSSRGKRILHDGAKKVCNHDIALLVLDEAIEDALILPVRLDGEVALGEHITAVGWGATGKEEFPSRRQQRTGSTVQEVGSGPPLLGPLTSEFSVHGSACSGDSGSPAIARETNSVIGVMSRGFVAAGCIDSKNIYTEVAPFRDLVLEGYALANAEPWLEGEPDPRKLKAKESCESDEDCRSSLCLPDPDAANEMTCAEDCSLTETCSVEGDLCTIEGDAKVCRAPKSATPPAASACTTSPIPLESPLRGSLFFALIAIASLRRKR